MARQTPARRVPASPSPSPFRSRALLAGLAVLCTLVSALGHPAPAASAEDSRERRFLLLVEAAELTDHLESSEADVVTAQLRRARTEADLTGLRDRMRTRAVTAYMRGTGASVAALTTPGVYLDVVAAKERELVTGFKAALVGVEVEQQRAEEARSEMRAAQRKLAAIQAELDSTIAAEDAYRAEEQRKADEARKAALAKQAAALAAARGQAGVGPAGVASPGGYAPSPLDPNALLPRHRAATDRQLALMRRIPFGPVAPIGPLPAGLATTGQRVEGDASWYGPGFNGRPTASGAIYDQEGWTVASKELPLGTLLAVSRGDRRVLLLVNDRGPYVGGRVLDLSAAAARALGVGGVAPVSAEVVAVPTVAARL